MAEQLVRARNGAGIGLDVREIDLDRLASGDTADDADEVEENEPEAEEA